MRVRVPPKIQIALFSLAWTFNIGLGVVARIARTAQTSRSKVEGLVRSSWIDSRVYEVVEVWGLGMGVNLPEPGQMLLTSSSQVDSLRGKMASNPAGVRAFGLTH